MNKHLFISVAAELRERQIDETLRRRKCRAAAATADGSNSIPTSFDESQTIPKSLRAAWLG